MNKMLSHAFTIGHSTRSLAQFIGLLHKAGATTVVDVRRFPHSPRQSHFNIETLPSELLKEKIEYRYMPALGGKRPPRSDGQTSPHGLWREGGFRNYADYAETPAFQIAFADLLKLPDRPAVMCAEADWRHCHRRIITDYLLASGVSVAHIMTNGIQAARITDHAIIRPDHTLLYSDLPLFNR